MYCLFSDGRCDGFISCLFWYSDPQFVPVSNELYHLKKKGKRPAKYPQGEGSFKKLVEPLKPSGRCAALPKLLRSRHEK